MIHSFPMDLFETPHSQSARFQPLAHRMRPVSLDEYLGQEDLLSEGRPLRAWIEKDQLPSLLLWGPPGCGKTTLALLIARATHSAFVSLSAVGSGVKDLREAGEAARQKLRFEGRKTLLFVDEIHRFNKGQQDCLLPYVEDGSMTLIGATTENPSFEINRALLSRMRVIRLKRLGDQDILNALRRALSDPHRGLGGSLELTDQALQFIVDHSDGDLRRALTFLDTLQLSPLPANADPTSRTVHYDLDAVRAALKQQDEREHLPYDRDGEEHHNTVSAFIKSMRASDPNAALYYLARLIAAGEDPVFIARRMVVFSAEDIGNAAPVAQVIAVAAMQSAELLGLPECRITLAQAVLYLARAPKSREAYDGIEAALREVSETGALPIPMQLRNPVTALLKTAGYGKKAKDVEEGASVGLLPRDVRSQVFVHPAKPKGSD